MSANVIPVAVVGAKGRLGAFASSLFEASSQFDLVARWERTDDWPALLAASGARVVFEATRAGLGHAHARLVLECGARPLVATSGVSPEQVAELDVLSRALALGGLVVPNFSLGAWVMQRACELAAPHFERAEIVEAHHTRKADAPSGTAADTARRITAARSRAGRAPLEAAGAGHAARGEVRDGIALHSLRLPGVYARQDAHFSGEGELFTVRHEMSGPEAFGPGILLAARYVDSCLGVGQGLDLALRGAV